MTQPLPVDYKNLTQPVTTPSAPAAITKWSHGKSRVRLVRIDRSDAKFDRVKEVTVETQLESDCGATYVTGDNSKVVATDTQKNTVYVVAKESFPAKASIEEFGIALGRRFVSEHSFVWSARIVLVQHGWQRAHFGPNQQPAHNTFVRAEPEQRTATVVVHRSGAVTVESGFQNLTVLKAGGSSFEGFPRTKLTTLPDATDRTLCTAITTKWTYADPTAKINFDAVYNKCREATLETVCTLNSGSVQQVMYDAAQLFLSRAPEVESVDSFMPNIHLFLFDISRFGLENNKEVYYPTSEPHGSIYVTLKRKPKAKL